MTVTIKCNPDTNVVDWVEYVIKFAGSGTYQRTGDDLKFNVSSHHVDLLKQLARNAAEEYSMEYAKEFPGDTRYTVDQLITIATKQA